MESRPVRQVTTRDGVRVSYTSIGTGPPLIFVRGWISHLGLMWNDPAFRAWVEALARQFTVFRYDARGNGLSEWAIDDFTLEGFVSDLEAVISEIPQPDVTLYGQCFGGPLAMAYAAQNPERVQRLVLDGTYASGAKITTPEHRQKLLVTLREFPEAGLALLSQYTQPHVQQPRFRQGGAPRAIRPDVASRLYEFGFRVDVSHLASRITTPTLVLHRRESRAIPIRLGRELASMIPGARLVEVPGVPHNPWEGDPAPLLEALGSFLGADISLQAEVPDFGKSSFLRTVLFTDIVSSTSLIERLGDVKATALMLTHDNVVSRALAQHDGIRVKSTGDGVLAMFSSASRALNCAIAIQRALTEAQPEHADEHAVQVRIGLNVGEPLETETDIFGSVVHLAARVCSYAGPGQILVPEHLRHLVAGKNFGFSDLGDVALKGFEEPVRLYQVVW